MRHFEKLSTEEVTKLAVQGGLHKNPLKGTGSLPKEERVERARDAANKRWRKDAQDNPETKDKDVTTADTE